jgi:hypothetical protein
VSTREFLRATVLKGARLELFPRADGGYDVRSEILPLRIPPALTRKSPGVSSGAFKPVVQAVAGARNSTFRPNNFKELQMCGCPLRT